LTPEPRHDLSPQEVDAVEDRLYEYNMAATGHRDGEGLGFVLRDNAGKTVGVVAGYTWARISEIRQMWVDEAWRGRGLGTVLLKAAVAECEKRGVKRIWVASYDFQAPGLYERAGFRRMAELDGWPDGHVNVILCKTLDPDFGDGD
jgi:N-acetylglutamate synthase-like GNAT family acetyltransferase